ncbi:MAG TPA: Rho termination factor N-terminal domain-containing protein [Cellvibrionaceae bacterium]
MVKNHGPTIKDDEQYQALRDQGMSKEKSARIANTPRSTVAKRGGKAPPYEEWKKSELYKKAAEVGIDGRSGMNKGDLIKALREH